MMVRWHPDPNVTPLEALSNSTIVSLSQGLPLAVASIVYLIVIHKLEHFLNARIIDPHINARACELLIAMLVVEAAFGIPGLLAAPYSIPAPRMSCTRKAWSNLFAIRHASLNAARFPEFIKENASEPAWF